MSIIPIEHEDNSSENDPLDIEKLSINTPCSDQLIIDKCTYTELLHSAAAA